MCIRDSTEVWQSYCKNSIGQFFCLTVYIPLVSVELCLILPPPSASSCSWCPLSPSSTFLTPGLPSRHSLVSLILCSRRSVLGRIVQHIERRPASDASVLPEKNGHIWTAKLLIDLQDAYRWKVFSSARLLFVFQICSAQPDDAADCWNTAKVACGVLSWFVFITEVL